MKLHLINGEVFEIFRQTCGHYQPSRYKETSCNWNIDPVQLVNDKESGYFAIGKWGCDGYWDNDHGVYVRTPEKFDDLIPIRNVLRVSDIGKWEQDDD